MHFDAVYANILRQLMDEGSSVRTTSKGVTQELIGHHFALSNPRDRIAFNDARRFNVFQAIGMWLWIASGRSDYGFIRYYNPQAAKFSADLRQVEGAYGPRLFGVGASRQIPRCIEILQSRPTSRQVVALVYEPLLDAHRHQQEGRKGEVPCTISLQFFLREGKLHCITNMRSQDALFLLPQDVFHFTLFQELVAASLGADLGTYYHHCGSIHYYEGSPINPAEVVRGRAGRRALMPAMEPEPQMPVLLRVLELEERIRVNAIDCVAQEGRRKTDSAQHLREAARFPSFWRDVLHACIGQAAIHTGEKKTLEGLTPKVAPWLQPFVRRAAELKGGERLLDNYGVIPGPALLE